MGAFDGPVKVSTGQRVNEWTARECETRQDWGNPVEEAKKVTANDSTFALAA